MVAPREAQRALVEYQVLRWIASLPEQSARASEWPGGSGLDPDDVESELAQLATQGLLSPDRRLAGAGYTLLPNGRQRLATLSEPATLKRTVATYLRDSWIDQLYVDGHTSMEDRCHPADLYGTRRFALAEPSSDNHEQALGYLLDKQLIDRHGAFQDPFLFVWLTSTGIDCAEDGSGVGSYLSRQAAGSFIQHNTFSNHGPAAAGRDHVSAMTVTIDTGATEQLRQLVSQIADYETREEGLLIVDDVEAAAKSHNDSKLKLRLRQLLGFAGRLTERAIATGIEAAVKAQIGS